MAVRLEKQDAVGHIILDRPPANSYDKAFLDELDAAIEAAKSDDQVKAIVVRSASEGTYKVGLPEVSLGLLPGTGGTQRLPRLIGRQKALGLMLRGTTLSPQEAKEAGIVDEVVPAADLLARATAMAQEFASGPSYARGEIKLAAVQGFGTTLKEGLAIER